MNMSEEAPGERILRFNGSHREIGQQIGVLYRSLSKEGLLVSKMDDREFTKQLSIYQTYFSEYLEWLEGVADGAGFSVADTIRSYISGFLNLSTRSHNTCSVFGLHMNGKVYVGRNYDWRAATEQSARKIIIEFTDGAHSFSALSDMSVWKMGTAANQKRYVVVTDDAWNEHGLFVCINGAPGPSINTGMSCVHIVQAAIEQCANTTEAVRLITKIPCNDPKLFTVIDKSGDMAVIEKPTYKKAVVVRSQEQIIATNHFQNESLKADNADIFEYVPFHSTFGRYAYLETCLANMIEPSVKQIKQLMLRPPVLQNWRGIDNGDTVTAWTEIIELQSGSSDIVFAPLA